VKKVKLSPKQRRIFWLCLFVLNVVLLAFMTLAMLLAVLILPDYRFSMDLPMKSWAVLLWGVDFKSVLLGFAIYWTYTEYREASEALKASEAPATESP
jgi:hypothetical protein